jgi:hypothetical protein
MNLIPILRNLRPTLAMAATTIGVSSLQKVAAEAMAEAQQAIEARDAAVAEMQSAREAVSAAEVARQVAWVSSEGERYADFLSALAAGLFDEQVTARYEVMTAPAEAHQEVPED